VTDRPVTLSPVRHWDGVVLLKVSEQVAECLRRAAEADTRAEVTDDPKDKIEYQRIASSWRTLARSYEFQGSLRRFISFNTERRDAIVDAVPALRDDAATVLANTPFLLTRCSSDLRYVFVSEAYARMLGHRPEELVGKKIADIIGETAFRTILPHVNAVMAGQRVEYETEVHYKGAGPRFVHVTYAPDKDGSGRVRGWVASIIDITEQRRGEQRIAANLRAMTLLGEVGAKCVRVGATMGECLHQILDAAIIIAGAQKGNIQLPEPSSGVLRIVAQRGFKESGTSPSIGVLGANDRVSHEKWNRIASASCVLRSPNRRATKFQARMLC
jgi:PAS domain S-box-containing protein